MSDDLRTDTRLIKHKIAQAWDRAGSMPAKEAVKVHPPDWHWMRDALVALCKERDALTTARDDALEEAAKVAETAWKASGHPVENHIPEAIRALKGKKP